MRRNVELQIITEALSKLGPHTPAARLWGRAPGASNEEGASGNVWAADIHDLALHICTRLFGRPDTTPQTTPQTSPLVQAEDAKRRRDLGGEIGALTAAERELTSAPWYPVRPGDLVHVHYEDTPTLAAFGETYIIGDVGDGLMNMELLSHTCRLDEPDSMTGHLSTQAADDPIYELWFEAGPHRLTIVRDGQVVHGGDGQG